MKILIADDEELVREGLKDILRGMAQGDEVFEAENGRILIEKAYEIKPDICFVDIRMPGVSGLEAIEKLTVDFPDISWIILSGYSDFDYARKALNLGVLDYLLKPATESEVETALQRAAEKRLDKGRLKREKFEYRVSGVLNNSSAVEFDEFLRQFEQFAACIFIPPVGEQPVLLELKREFINILRYNLDHTPPEDYAGVFILPDGFPAVIAAGETPAVLVRVLENKLSVKLKGSERVYFSPEFKNLGELIEYIENLPELKTDEDSLLLDEPGEKSSRIVRQAEKLVLEQYMNPIGVAQIADVLNVTPNYLSSLFKKYNKISFTKFITDIRLNEAPKILEVPGITVKEAALKLGYMSSRHFTRLFREKYGMPPTDYINRKR